LKRVFDELAADHFLEGLPRREFARKIAALFSEINRIHSFREGNGRTQRQFVRQLADSLGFKLHFEVVSKERLIQASILSANGDVAMMERLMDEITDTERVQSLAKVIAHLENSRFGWNDIYLATPEKTMLAHSPVATEPTFPFAMTKTEFSWEMSKT
jgi:cell filamentation protein